MPAAIQHAAAPVQPPPALVKAAQAFEASTLNELLQPMFDTVDSAHGTFGGGDGEAAWRPMLVEAMAKNIAAHGGLGLAGPVLRQMMQMQEQAG
jgi:Rod binding domain-containing protein